MDRSRGLAVLLLLSAARAGTSQESAAPADASVPPGAEGPLDNDAFVPVAEPVLAALAAGDTALARARAAPPSTPAAERERLLDSALDHWHSALVQSPPGAWSWFDLDAAATRRLCEGVRAAVERRLLSLSSDERPRWGARLLPATTSALARLERASLADRPALAGMLVRLYPHTPAAARAALLLGDLALESGLAARARGWYARAELEAGLAGEGGAFAAALAARGFPLAGPQAPAEAWRTASGAEFGAALAFAPLAARPASSGARERWPRPGGTFLDDGRFALQTLEDVLLYELAPSGGLALSARVRLEDHLAGTPLELRFDAPRVAPGWPLLPAACGAHLALIVGRTRAEEPNGLLVLELEPARPHASLGLAVGQEEADARLAWAIVAGELVRGEEARELPELAALGEYEFQPGPVATSDWIVTQVRAYAGRVRAWLFAFDRRDGSLAWTLELAGGAERVVMQRFGVNAARVAAQPLLAFELDGEARLFAGTHLGLGALVDALTGEPLFGLKNRRRAEHEPGWSGERPPLGTDAHGAPAILWAPADSDRLYTLRPFALAGTGIEDDAAQLAPPAPLQDARTLLGGDAAEHVVLGHTGRERTVSARRAGRDRIDALDLGEDERFRGAGLVSPERVWVASDRSLYLFDRRRELYLLDCEVLPPAGEPPAGGDLYARGDHVLVVGPGAVWSFRAR